MLALSSVSRPAPPSRHTAAQPRKVMRPARPLRLPTRALSPEAHHALALGLSVAAGGLTAKGVRQLNHQTNTLRASDMGGVAGAALGAAMLGNHQVVERLGVSGWVLPVTLMVGSAYWFLTEGGKRTPIAGEWAMVGGLGGVGAGLCASLFETLVQHGVPVELALPLSVALPAGVLGSTA